MPANDEDHLGEQFVSVLPAGSALYHSTYAYQAEAIRREGIRSSRMGESGPGVYTTPINKGVYGYQNPAGEPQRQTLEFETTQDLRLLDRGLPGGEERYREMHAGYDDEASKRMIANLRQAGYHGVRYPTTLRGKDATEIVVHDPAHLRLRDE